MELLIGTFVLLGVLIGLAAYRLSRIASWRAIAMVAVSTASLREVVEFIRYCERL